MIESQAALIQARQQLQQMEDAVAALMRDAESMHPSQLSIQLEGPLEMVSRLRAEVDEYLGIQRAMSLIGSAEAQLD